jgi:hypothetical protein
MREEERKLDMYGCVLVRSEYSTRYPYLMEFFETKGVVDRSVDTTYEKLLEILRYFYTGNNWKEPPIERYVCK